MEEIRKINPPAMYYFTGTGVPPKEEGELESLCITPKGIYTKTLYDGEPIWAALFTIS